MKNRKGTMFICTHQHIPFDAIIVGALFGRYSSANLNAITTVHGTKILCGFWNVYRLRRASRCLMKSKSKKADYVELNHRISNGENILLFLRDKQRHTAKGPCEIYKSTSCNIVLIRFERKQGQKKYEVKFTEVKKKKLDTNHYKNFNDPLFNCMYPL
jgi:hypothetical protein